MNFATFQGTEGGRKSPARRAENQDRVLCRTLPVGDVSGVLLAIADGITQCPNGGSVAHWLVAKHLKDDAIDLPVGRKPAVSLQGYLERLYGEFKAEFAMPEYEGMLNSGASLSVVLLHDQVADCLWAGDSPIYHSRKVRKDYETQLLTRPDHERSGQLNNCFGAHAAFTLHHCRVQLAVDDIMTVTSDGILVDDYTLGRIYGAKGFGSAAIQEMFRISRRAPFWDDLSVAAGKASA